MLQAFFPDATYNETVSWPFARLADLWGGRGFEIRTPRGLRDALEAAWQNPASRSSKLRSSRATCRPSSGGFVAAFKGQVYSS